MAIFGLNAHQRQLLASCIEIGLEGASDNHKDTGGENSQQDLDIITALLAELTESEAEATEITVMPTIAECEGSRVHGLRNQMLEEVADGAYGDGPHRRGLARRQLDI